MVEGLTLRDWFAGQAFSRLIGDKGVFNACCKDANEMGDTIYDQIAWHAYKHADAMLKARES